MQDIIRVNGQQRQVLFLIVAIMICSTTCATCVHADETHSRPPSDHVTTSDRDFWSFRKLSRPAIPDPKSFSRARTAIDSFILSSLEAKEISLSPDADRVTLVRRVFLDLMGLPPSPSEVDQFLADESPDACERLVDRLLVSPFFGERWGRHWLDVAGYVDTVGFDVDVDLVIQSEGKWLYRDYVIRALNEDKPFDRFIHEQLAGDELVDWRHAATFTPEIRELLIATGYLRNAQDLTHEDVGNIPPNHFGTLHDTLEIVGSSLLGLTLNCARCHNHKFDPVPQLDYYRLMALFAPAYNPDDWKIVIPYDKKLPDRTLADVSLPDRAEIERHNGEIDNHVAQLAKKLEELRRPHREQMLEQRLATIPEPIRVDTKAAIAVPAEKRSEVQAYLASKFAGSLKVSDDEISAAFSLEDKSAAAEITTQTATLNRLRKHFGKIQALFDVGPLPTSRLLIRGNYEMPGDEVQPGLLRVLCDGDSTALLGQAPVPHQGTSGRRLALANRLTERDSRAAALLARVTVNRVWQHLFQTGIVRTPENFGFAGASPTHPELLEWMSAQLVESGWRLKPLIRSIVSSATYQQSSDQNGSVNASTSSSDPISIDPDNRLLWHMPLKRLDSEAIRDSTLAACGTIDPRLGGPPIMLEGKPDGMIVVAEKQLPYPSAKWRRSVYLLSRRAFQLSELSVFDQPVVATNCPERARSAVPLQSLALLNGAFLWDQAELLSAQINADTSVPFENRIAAAFQRILVRKPSNLEFNNSLQYLEAQSRLYRQKGLEAEAASQKSLVHLCHSLLGTSEFLYVP